MEGVVFDRGVQKCGLALQGSAVIETPLAAEKRRDFHRSEL